MNIVLMRYIFVFSFFRYEPVFMKNGFETVEALVLVKERDIDELGLLLGHKRKLQSALKEFRGRHL